MPFEFATANQVVFGRGCAARIGAEAARFGTRAFVLTGKNSSRWDFLWKDLRARGLAWKRFAIPSEPTVLITTGPSRSSQALLAASGILAMFCAFSFRMSELLWLKLARFYTPCPW